MTLDEIIRAIIGPAGATILLVVVVVSLWRDHLRADADDRAQRDRALAIVELVAPALEKLATAQEASNRDALLRHRREDA